MGQIFRPALNLAGVAGLEPTMQGSKPCALPLGDTPMNEFYQFRYPVAFCWIAHAFPDATQMVSPTPSPASPAFSPCILVGSFDSRKAALFVDYADRVSPKRCSVAFGPPTKLCFVHACPRPWRVVRPSISVASCRLRRPILARDHVRHAIYAPCGEAVPADGQAG